MAAAISDILDKEGCIIDKSIPVIFICPITKLIMADPVVTAAGNNTYEREAIERWLESHNTDPGNGNVQLENKNLFPNNTLRSKIAEFLTQHPQFKTAEHMYVSLSSQKIIKGLVDAIKTNQFDKVACVLRDQRLLTLELENKYTAFHLAAEFGSSELVEFILTELTHNNLLEQIIVLPKPERFNPRFLNTGFQQAVEKMDQNKFAVLLKLGADFEQPDGSGNTLLHRFAITGNSAQIRLLLSAKPELEKRNIVGNTPLLLAVMANNIETTAILLQHGAQQQVENNKHQRPIDLAAANHNEQILEILLQDGGQFIQSLTQDPRKALSVATDDYILPQIGTAKIVIEEQPLVLAVDSEDPIVRQRRSRMQAQQLGVGMPLFARMPVHNENEAKVAAAEVEKFLQYIAAGNQDAAEKMLQHIPALAMARGNVMDHADRTFRGITGFQLAIWYLDWHMWNKIREYLSHDAARKQVINIENSLWIQEHGEHANWQQLIDSLQHCIDYKLCPSFSISEVVDRPEQLWFDRVFSDIRKAWLDIKTSAYWINTVGGYQRLLPMHVLQEYRHTQRAFRHFSLLECKYVPATFLEDLPRTSGGKIFRFGDVDTSNWCASDLDVEFNIAYLGREYAIARANCLQVNLGYRSSRTYFYDNIGAGRDRFSISENMIDNWLEIDRDALIKLQQVRLQQRMELLDEFILGIVPLDKARQSSFLRSCSLM